MEMLLIGFLKIAFSVMDNPLINNSAVKQFSENSKSDFESFKVKSVIKEL
uniref:Uncharacterized protein n=1 Tax=Wolbachia endosymbiont of Aleurodicus dispersus TaxID=1288877 RepID=A0A3B0IVL9_9RICK